MPASTDQAQYQQIGKVSSESVEKHTGRGWKYWMDVLQKAGARTWTYQEIVAHLKKKHRLTPWWQHGVALGFEIFTGRRAVGQDAKGKYMVTATCSLPHSAHAVWNALMSQAGQAIWLDPMYSLELEPGAAFETNDGFYGEVRTLKIARRLRLAWQDPAWDFKTVLEVHLVPRPGQKAILVFNHTGLDSEQTKARLKIRWRAAADAVPGLLSEAPPERKPLKGKASVKQKRKK